MAGNFNMTNVDELFDILVPRPAAPKEKVDTVTVMEKIGHFWTRRYRAVQKYKGNLPAGNFGNHRKRNRPAERVETGVQGF